jgi:hypothetical protein
VESVAVDCKHVSRGVTLASCQVAGIPLVDVEVLRKVSSEASSRR